MNETNTSPNLRSLQGVYRLNNSTHHIRTGKQRSERLYVPSPFGAWIKRVLGRRTLATLVKLEKSIKSYS